MFWFPVLAAGAAAAFAGKLIARKLNGQLAHSAVNDPPGTRTRVRFEADAATARSLLDEVAAAITPIVQPAEPFEINAVAVRVREVDILRLAEHSGGYTLTLTRAWTGAQLNAVAVDLLERLHELLANLPGIRGLAWFARQDRELATGYPYPFDP